MNRPSDPASELEQALDRLEADPRSARDPGQVLLLYRRTIEVWAGMGSEADPAERGRVNDVLARAALVVHARPPVRGREIVTALRRQILEPLRESRGALMVSLALAVGGFAAGLAAMDSGSRILRLLFDPSALDLLASSAPSKSYGWSRCLLDLEMSQIRLALAGLTSGILAGFGPILAVFLAGVIHGGLVSVTLHNGTFLAMLPYHLALGLTGLLLVVLFGAAGLSLGFAAVAPGRLSRRAALARAGRQVVSLLVVAAAVIALRCLALLVVP